MRILVLTTGYPFPPADGTTIRTYNLIKALQRRGHRIDLACFHESPVPEAATQEMARWCGAEHRVEVNFYPPPSWHGWLRKRLSFRPATMVQYDVPAMRELVRTLAAGAYDVVYVDQIHMAAYARWLPFPRILNANDSISLFLEREPPERARRLNRASHQWETRKYRRYERRVYPKFHRVVLVSEADGHHVRERIGHREITIIPNGVDTTYFRPGATGTDPAETPEILFTGMMRYPPNYRAALHFARDVWPGIVRVHPEARFIIAGAYPTDELHELARRDERIVVTGFVEDLRPWFERAWVYVSPLRSGTGIKNKVLEAMAMGRPVVASPLSVEGLPLARAGEDYVLAPDAETMAGQVLALLGSPEHRRRLGASGRACVERHYSWDRAAAEVDHLLHDAVSRA